MITAGQVASRAIQRRVLGMGAVMTVLWAGLLPRYLLLDAVAKPTASWTGLGTGLGAIGLTLALISIRVWRGARPHLAFRAAMDFAIVSMLMALLGWFLNQRGDGVPYVESFSILLLDVATGWLTSLGIYVWCRRRLRHLTGVAHLRGLPTLRTVFWVSATVVGGAAAVVLGVGSSARAAGALDRLAGGYLAELTEMMGVAMDAAETPEERLHVLHLLDTELNVEAMLLPEGERPRALPLSHPADRDGAFVVLEQRARAHWSRLTTHHGVLWLTSPANVRPPVRAPDDAPAMLILALLVLGAPVAAWAVGQDLSAELWGVTQALDGMASGVQGGPLGVPVWSDDEVGDVAAQLNAVCERYSNQHRILTADLDAAEGSDRARGRFLAAASHELRTPLNTIAGFCHLLAGDTAVSEGQRDDVLTIADAADQLLGHVDEILALSEMVTEPALVYTPVDLTAVARALVDRLAPRHQLSVAVHAAADTPLARGDQRRLGQVIENLFGNAIKFTVEGAVTIHLGPADIGGAPAVRLEVRDTGPGIPRAELEDIFTEFHRVEAQREVVGTGLGLAIARRLVDRHDGRLWAESTLGSGSAFILLIPAWEAAS